MLVAVPALLGSLGRFPAGLLADHYGSRRLFVGLMFLLVLPTTLAGFATSYAELLFWSLWLGIAGSSLAIGIPFVAGWFSRRRQGLALGTWASTAPATLALPWLRCLRRRLSRASARPPSSGSPL